MSEEHLAFVQLSPIQSALWSRILDSTLALQSDQVVLVTEYLGYLPFGLYHWLECAGQDISRDWPSVWQDSDIVALEAAGGLILLSVWHNPDDGLERKTSFRVVMDADLKWENAAVEFREIGPDPNSVEKNSAEKNSAENPS
jgi:hypothetical protein